MRPSDDSVVGLPSCSFGPLLNFFGLWGSPGTGRGGRRLLAAETQAAAASQTAASGSGRVRHTSLGAGPVTEAGRVQAAAADDWQQDDGSDAWQQDGGTNADSSDVPQDDSSGSRAWASAESWCTREGWWVEQVSSGKSVWPPDLHRAQVEARRSGRMR